METELSRVVDTLPGLIWTALSDGRVDFLNQRWCEYTGLPAAESYGDRWQTAVHPGDLPALLERWREIVASGKPGAMEARLRRFDGEYRWFQLRACPLRDASGQVTWCGMNSDIEDRRTTEDGLRALERRFRLVVDGLPAVVTLMTPEGELDSANRHMLEYFGATLEELKTRPTTQSFHPDDRPEVDARWRRSVETGEPYDFEARLRRADGVYRWFHTRGFPLRDAAGRVVVWYLLQTDVDDRKRAEALLAGEKRFLEMVAAGQSMSRILDALCRLVESTTSGCYCSIVLVDPSGTRLEHGAAPSLPASFITAIIGRPVNVDSGPCAMAAYLNEQVIADDLTSETRWAAYEWCPIALAHGVQACWSTPITSTDGSVLGAFAIYYDEPKTPTAVHQDLIEQFTHIARIAIERAQHDAALKRSEARKTAVLNSALDGIVTMDHEGCITEFNPAAERTFGYRRDQVLGQQLADVIIPASLRDQHRRGLARYLVTGENRVLGKRMEMTAVRADGSEFPVELAITRIPSDGPPSFTGYLRDITERKRAEAALAKARSELAHVARVTTLGVMTASIAHEVNQPLSGIITNASTCLKMLAGDPPDVDGALETARRTIRDGHRAAEVIARLRALFSKEDVATESVDLNEATREVIALSATELQRSRVVLRSEFADGLPAVTGDRVQLQQVILNLLRNASDAMEGVDDRPRQLLIRTERHDGDGVRLTVRDAGVGVTPQETSKLFDAFYTTKSGGMGIGLSVSRSIIEKHQGRLWAETNDGPGATFSFSIPSRQGVA